MDKSNGQITYRRAVSKRLVFYDLKCSSSSDWLELVVKEGVYGSIQDVKDLRDSVKLGDVVAVRGQFENRQSLQVQQMTVTQPWHTAGQPKVPFIPQPSSLHPQQRHEAMKSPLQQQMEPPLHKQQQGTASDAVTGSRCEAAASEALPSVSASSPVVAAAEPGAGVSVMVQQPQLTVCKFWVNSGRCAKGAACPHSHLQLAALPAARNSWLTQRKGRRQVLSSSQGFHASDSAASHRHRAAVFASWLLDVFGRELLNAGVGVLDVAGGAGGMTFELTAVHGIKCTLIDPRPFKLSTAQLRLLQQAGRSALLTKLITAEQTQQGLMPQTHVLLEAQQQAQQQQQQQQQPHQQQVEFRQVQCCFGPELWHSSGWRQQQLDSCSLVLGLHPDQATEPIVDFALQMHRPFAVVPCCVFPRLFPNRRVSQGDGSLQEVVSYAQLVQYLMQKGRVQQHVLGFEGANTVVYSRQECSM